MYSRARPYLRQRSVSELFRSASSRPSPALDFLYPRWFTQAAATSQLPGEQIPVAELDNTAPVDRHQDTKVSQVAAARKQHNAIYFNSAQLSAKIHDNETASGKPNKLIRSLRHHKRRRTLGNTKKHDGDGDNIVRKVPFHENYTGQVQELKQTILGAMHEPNNMLWIYPARILLCAMQRPIHREGVSIHLHERTLIHLTGTQLENTWIHHVYDGCEIRVCARTPLSTANREVILYGDAAAVETTKEYLLADEQSLLGSNANSTPDIENIDSTGSEIRYMGTNADYSNSPKWARAASPQVPSNWSIRTFAQYVRDLCHVSMGPALEREYHRRREENLNQKVVTELEALFTNTELEPYFSGFAFTVALQFICRHTQSKRAKDLLYKKAKSCGLHRQTRLFNVMVESALQFNQLKNLRSIVRDMISAGIEPDGVTWSKLLSVTEDTGAREQILDFILRAYPSEFASVQQDVVDGLIEQEMLAVVHESGGFQRFRKRMDESFGAGWLTGQTLNRILITCAQNKLWEAADDALELASERELQLQQKSISALFYLHSRRGDVNKAIDLLQQPRVLDDRLNHDIAAWIHLAFGTAWEGERYNLCRVLWQYAASRGLITSSMASCVAQSVRQAQHIGILNLWSFNDLAGKIIIGTDLDTTGFDRQFPRLSRYFSTTKDPLQWLSQGVPDESTRAEQLSLAYLLIGRDLDAWKTLKPLPNDLFREFLKTAKRRDQAWVDERFADHATLAEILTHAVRVPAIQRSTDVPHEDMNAPGEADGKMQTNANPSTARMWRRVLTLDSTQLTPFAAPLLNLLLGSSTLKGNLSPVSMSQTVTARSIALFREWYNVIAQRLGKSSTNDLSVTG